MGRVIFLLLLLFHGAAYAQGTERVRLTDGSRLGGILETGSTDYLGVGIVDGSGNQITSFGGGTQYTEGDTDASITGSALMWEDTGDTLRAVSSAKPLPVDLQDTSVAVTGTFWQATQPVSLASVPSHDVTNAGTFAVQVTSAPTTTVTATNLDVQIGGSDTLTVSDGSGAMNVIVDSITAGDNNIGNVDVLTMPTTTVTATNLDVQIGGSDTVTVTATNLDVQIGGSDSLTIGTFPDNEPINVAQMNGTAVSMGVGNTGTGTQRVVTATGGTATSSQVADTGTSTTILAANTSRRSASVTNDSSAVLYLLVGSGTASSTVYTYRLAQYASVIIDSTSVQLTGVWASDPNDGAARVTEIT